MSPAGVVANTTNVERTTNMEKTLFARLLLVLVISASGSGYHGSDICDRSPAQCSRLNRAQQKLCGVHIPFELQADYHVWGLEWNKDVIRFYLDGVLYREAENTHWHQPLAINLNCESNKWLNALPDDSRLDGRYRVKYFRAWQQER